MCAYHLSRLCRVVGGNLRQIARQLPIDRLERKRRGKMDGDFGGQFTHFGAYFQQTQLQDIELGLGPLRPSQPLFSERMQQNIGGTMQEQAQVIGFELVT